MVMGKRYGPQRLSHRELATHNGHAHSDNFAEVAEAEDVGIVRKVERPQRDASDRVDG